MEVGVTHPLDYIKTVIQSKSGKFLDDTSKPKIRTINLLKTPYKGILTKLAGTIPMRILFWTSLDRFNKMGYNPTTSAILTSFIQTTIDLSLIHI